MGITTNDGQYVGNPTDSSDRLTKASEIIQSARQTDLFGLEGSQNTDDPAVHDPYKGDHKTSIQVSVFMGQFWLGEAAGIEMIDDNTKTPVWHYAGTHYNAVLEGKYTARGNLYIYETKTAEFQASIAKYKRLLKEELVEETTIREIAAQRLNLFRASIEGQLLTRFGADQAADLAQRAVSEVTTEIVSGDMWGIPKLTIVSGDIVDDEPLIDVFEDVTIHRTSKTIVPDGGTQMRVYTWFARKRPNRDEAQELSAPDKWEVDLEETVRSYARSYAERAIQGIREDIERIRFPKLLSPNNISWTGSLPNAITGWGPKMCICGLRFSQEVPDTIKYQGIIHLFRRQLRSDGTTERVDDERERSNVVNDNARYMSPDSFNLISSATVISRAFPSNRNMAFSWTLGTPVVGSDFKILDEYLTGLHGSALVNAWYNLSMVTIPQGTGASAPEEDISRVHQPVRSFSYVANPRYVKSSEEEPAELKSYKPITMAHSMKSPGNGGLNRWIDTMEVTAEDGSPAEYEYDQWFAFGFKLIAGLTTDDGETIVDDLLEAITLGLINIDGLETYEEDMDLLPVGQAVENVCVQVYPVITDKDFDFLGVVPDFRINERITREDAIEVFEEGTCVEEGVRYIWSLRDIGRADAELLPKLRMATIWDKTALAGQTFKNIILLTRVFVESPAIPGPGSQPGEHMDEGFLRVADHTEFVSPTSFIMNKRTDLDIFARMDRTYIDYVDREPFSLFTSGSQDEVSASSILPTFMDEGTHNFKINDIARLYTLTLGFTGSIQDVSALISGRERLRTGPVLQEGSTLKADFYERNSARLSNAGVQTVNAVRNAGVGLININRGAVDIAQQSVNSILGNALFRNIGRFTDNLIGIDFVNGIRGIFQDSRMRSGTEVSPSMVAGWFGKTRYIALIEPLANRLAEQVVADLEGLQGILDDPRLFEVEGYRGDQPSSRLERIDRSLVKERMLNALVEEFTRAGRSRDYEVTRTRTGQVDPTRMAPIPDDPFNAGQGIKPSSPVIAIEKNPPPPSPFILDNVTQGLQQEYLEESDEEKEEAIGIEIPS